MAGKRDLTPKLLRQLLHYDAKTGKLFWKPRHVGLFHDGKQSAEHNCNAWNNRHSGAEAFTADSGSGYKQACIFYGRYYAHRVAWAIHYGEWPSLEIDHINRDRSDNRISNLRCVSHGDNLKNLPKSKSNTSGVTGVHFDLSRKKWVAYITHDYERKHLGRFSTMEDAVIARRAAEKSLGFHRTHGR